MPDLICDKSSLSSWKYNLSESSDPEENSISVNIIVTRELTDFFKLNDDETQITVNEGEINLDKFPTGSFVVNIQLMD